MNLFGFIFELSGLNFFSNTHTHTHDDCASRDTNIKKKKKNICDGIQ